MGARSSRGRRLAGIAAPLLLIAGCASATRRATARAWVPAGRFASSPGEQGFAIAR